MFAQQFSNEAERKAETFYKQCEADHANGNGFDCWTARQEIYESHTSKLQYGLWGFSAAMAGVFLALALTALGIVYWSARWIIAGREPG